MLNQTQKESALLYKVYTGFLTLITTRRVRYYYFLFYFTVEEIEAEKV